MECRRKFPKFCQGKAVGIVRNGDIQIAICNGCREHNEPFVEKFNE